MKTCETCGKVLNDSTEEYTVNGIMQCRDCAYPNHKEIAAKMEQQRRIEAENLLRETELRTNKWAGIIKIVGTINLIAGIFASIIGGVVAGLMIGDEIGFAAGFTIILIGIILSVVSQAIMMCFAELAADVSMIKSHLIN